MFNLRQVVVTGVGCISPLGHDVKSTWDGLLAGRSGISEISRFDASGIASQIAGQADTFDPETRLGTQDTRRMDRSFQIGVYAWP